MLVLLETPAGYGLFKVTNSKILECNADQVSSYFEDSTLANSSVALKSFMKFKSSDDALKEANALMESKVGKALKKFLKRNVVKSDIREELGISDKLLGVEIQNKLNIQVIYNHNTLEILRGIRLYFHDLVNGLSEDDTKAMTLSLSHSLTRFRLKFSPDKVDIMIVQAIGLLDDLDREINKFGMRLKEWYGWHFPELTKIVPDTLMYSRVVKLVGMRENAKNSDLASLLPAEVCREIHQAAEISMGSEMFTDDLESITTLAIRLEELIVYRGNLEEYLKYRMNLLAPNLSYMVGELVGARLLSHAGSLVSLAKHPASTIQILGAEKALFRALKSKSSTPKYGLIYHASLVGQSTPKLKGKISRILAAKLALCVRVDALRENKGATVAIENRRYVENRLHILSSQGSSHIQEVRSKTLYRPSWESNEQSSKKRRA